MKPSLYSLIIFLLLSHQLFSQNVGIGTTAPQSKLHVNGDVKIDSNYVLEFGAGLTKEANAGKIGYQTFSPGLDIVGAGNGLDRIINFYNEGGSSFTGAITSAGSVNANGGFFGNFPFSTSLINRLSLRTNGNALYFTNPFFTGLPSFTVADTASQSFTAPGSFLLLRLNFNFTQGGTRNFTMYLGDSIGGTIVASGTIGSGTGNVTGPTINYNLVDGQKYTIMVDNALGWAYSTNNKYAAGESSIGPLNDFCFGLIMGNVSFFNVNNSGNVSAIGKLTVSELQLRGGSTNKILISDSAGNARWGDFSASTNWGSNGNHLYNLNSGNVGINNINPTSTLHVNGTGTFTGKITADDSLIVSGGIRSNSLRITNGATSGYILSSDASGNAAWTNPSTFFNNFWTATGNNISNNNTGNIGIGISSPSSKLHVNGTGTFTGKLNANDSLVVISGIRLLADQRIHGNNFLEFGYGLTKEVNAGKIGYQIFSSGLDIVGAGNTGTNRKITFYNEGGANFNGNVGIGTTTPAAALDVSDIGDSVLFVRGSNSQIRIVENDNANKLWMLGVNGGKFFISESGGQTALLIEPGTGDVWVKGLVKQLNFTLGINVGASSMQSYIWNHNLGYKPIIMITKDQTIGGYLDYVNVCYEHIDFNNLRVIYRNTNGFNTASGRLHWIVVGE